MTLTTVLRIVLQVKKLCMYISTTIMPGQICFCLDMSDHVWMLGGILSSAAITTHL